MGYTTHIVSQGDCISSIAFDRGFFPDTIWNDPKNSKLKQDRKDPNVLMPGDEVHIREKEGKDESCASERRHRFRRKGVPENLWVQFKVSGKPRADEAYVLDIDGQLSEAETNTNGEVRIPIVPNAKTARISFRESGDEYELKLGHLDPITEISGVQGRLADLGFYHGPIDGQTSAALERSVQAFQKEKSLETTGKLDQKTLDMLGTAFGD